MTLVKVSDSVVEDVFSQFLINSFRFEPSVNYGALTNGKLKRT